MVRPADALTVARAMAALPVGVLIQRGHDRGAALLFALASLTDLVDGVLARRDGGSVLGQQLDPLADKLVTDTALLALAVRGRAPWALVIVLIARDVTVSALRAAGRESLRPTTLARWKTGLLYACATGLIAAPAGSAIQCASRVGLGLAVALAALSGLSYLRQR